MPGVVLVTGSSSGFGRLTAEAIARTGHSVCVSMCDTADRSARNAAGAYSLVERFPWTQAGRCPMKDEDAGLAESLLRPPRQRALTLKPRRDDAPPEDGAPYRCDYQDGISAPLNSSLMKALMLSS